MTLKDHYDSIGHKKGSVQRLEPHLKLHSRFIVFCVDKCSQMMEQLFLGCWRLCQTGLMSCSRLRINR